MAECIICGDPAIKILRANQTGYVEGTRFDIAVCGKCGTHFISPIKVPAQLYDVIYSEASTPGYERYFEFANTVKNQADPLGYLAEREATYFAVAHALKNKPSLDVLEVGCGCGYLTYALNQAGHRVIGIDLSAKAVEYARKNFGDGFFNETVEAFAVKNVAKFDVVIFTEVIEHLSDPVSFITACREMLRPGGRLVLTTPDRDFFDAKSVWYTDLPPVHTLWLRKQSFEFLAVRLGLNLEFIDFRCWPSKKMNQLIHFLLTRKEPAASPTLNADGTPKHTLAQARSEEPFLKKLFKAVLVDFLPMVKLSNFLYHTFKINGGRFPQMGVVLTKKTQ